MRLEIVPSWNHFLLPAFCPWRISLGSWGEILLFVPAAHPLRDTPRHVIHPVGTLARLVTADWSETVTIEVVCNGLIVIRQFEGGLFITPRVRSTVCSSRRLLPLSLGGQALADPPTVGIRRRPAHPHHRPITVVRQGDLLPRHRQWPRMT